MSTDTPRPNGSRDESGFTLVELVIALFVFSLVTLSVSVSLTDVTKQTTSLSQSTQAIDQLQLAEENITSDVHAAVGWCSNPSASALDFNASLGGASPTIDITLSGTTSKTLTIAVGSSGNCTSTVTTTKTVSSLDSSSVFTPTTASWTPTDGEAKQTFYDTVGVLLTLDSPSPSAPRPTKTTMSDPSIVANSIEYACQSAWSNEPGSGSSPC